MNWILDRLSENSTWRGIVLILTATGIFVNNPNLPEAISAFGFATVGLINVIRKGSAK